MSAAMQDDSGPRDADEFLKAFESFFRREEKRLLRWIRARTRNNSDPEDVAQETWLGFVKAVRRPEFLASPDSALGLLYWIAYCRIADHFRGRNDDVALPLDPPDNNGGLDPETITLIRETVARLMDVLNDRERDVIRSMCWDGEDEAAIARRLGITGAGVRKILQRARQKMRDKGKLLDEFGH